MKVFISLSTQYISSVICKIISAHFFRKPQYANARLICYHDPGWYMGFSPTDHLPQLLFYVCEIMKHIL